MTRREKKDFEERLQTFADNHRHKRGGCFTQEIPPLDEKIVQKWEELKTKLAIPELEEFLLKD